MKQYQNHPATSMFPLLGVREMEELVRDIRENGLKQPIVLMQGQVILDGRNRYLACQQLGIRPRFVEFEGTESEAFRYIVSANLHRRHLSESQRAMVAAMILRQSAQGGEHVTKCKAAELMNVSRNSVRSAEHVQENGIPQLIDAVQDGRIAVSCAEEIAELPKRAQRKVIAHQGRSKLNAVLREIQKKTHETPEVATKSLRPVWTQEPPDEDGFYWMKRGKEKPEIVEYCAKREWIMAIFTFGWEGAMKMRCVPKKTFWCRIHEPVFKENNS